MKTIYSPYALEFKRKPPKLKFNILERLAIDGKTSKSGLESNLKDRYYPDISRSVDDLKRMILSRCPGMIHRRVNRLH
jgi:hypothetical protein